VQKFAIRGEDLPPLHSFSISFLFFVYQAVASYTAAMQPFTRWMWNDTSRLNRFQLIHVNEVIASHKDTSSTSSPREFSISFLGKLHFFKPWWWACWKATNYKSIFASFAKC